MSRVEDADALDFGLVLEDAHYEFESFSQIEPFLVARKPLVLDQVQTEQVLDETLHKLQLRQYNRSLDFEFANLVPIHDPQVAQNLDHTLH